MGDFDLNNHMDFAVAENQYNASGLAIVLNNGNFNFDPVFSFYIGDQPRGPANADFDLDGDLDIASGRNWYEAPSWTKHASYRDGAEINGPETDDNSEFAMDVKFEGQTDSVSWGWMFMKGGFCYECDGEDVVVWKLTRI